MNWKLAHASVRGSAHTRSGLPNQDAAQCIVIPGEGDVPTVTVAAVSDGHGSARHFRSQAGSALAVSASVDVLLEFFSDTSDTSNRSIASSRLEDLQKSLVDNWLAAVASDLEIHPLTEEELHNLDALKGSKSRLAVENEPVLAYGATLLVAAATDSLMVLLQLGDGEMLCVTSDGQTTRPMPDDPRLSGNETTSLCQPEAWREFRSAWFVAPEWPALVLLATDGYPNSFRSGDDFFRIGAQYLGMIREKGIKSVVEDLPHILSEASHHGSGDDITLAILQGELKESFVPDHPAFAKPAVSSAMPSIGNAKSGVRHPAGPEQPSISLEPQTRHLMLRLILFLLILVVVGAVYFLRGRFHLPS
jgi:serine/threonine protein phosphatase PrpC